MGLFSKSAPSSSSKDQQQDPVYPQDPSTIIEGAPEVPDCITPYESGLMSALGKTSGELTKSNEGVLQALMQSARSSPYHIADDKAPSSSACLEERQLVKDCLQRISSEAKAQRFKNGGEADAVATTSNTIDASSSSRSTIVAPPPSFLFANFPSCDAIIKRYTACSAKVSDEYTSGYKQKVEAMMAKRDAMARGPSLPQEQ